MVGKSLSRRTYSMFQQTEVKSYSSVTYFHKHVFPFFLVHGAENSMLKNR